MTYDIDQAILDYLEEHDDGDGVSRSELIREVCPKPRTDMNRAMVETRLYKLMRETEIYSPTPEPRYRRP